MKLLLNPGTADPEINKKRLPQKFRAGLHTAQVSISDSGQAWHPMWAPHLPWCALTTDPIATRFFGSFREVAGRSQLVIFTCNSCFLSLLGSNQNPEASGHTPLACVGGKGPKVGLLGTHRTPSPVPLEGVLFACGGSRGTKLGFSAASHFGNLNDRAD